MKRSAVISKDLIYRYRLSRKWGRGVCRTLCFIMLNPSTADMYLDDPTVRLCVGWAKRLRPAFNRVMVVNLYAYRATDPKRLFLMLKEGFDVVGPLNDKYIMDEASKATQVICAWGNQGGNRADVVLNMLQEAGIDCYCLKMSKRNQPVHPLRQPYYLNPQPIPSPYE